MSVEALAWALATPTGSVSRKAVLLSLANCHNAHTNRCCPRIARMASETDLSERTVKRALVDLEEAGIIERNRRRRKDGTLGVYDFILRMDSLSSPGATVAPSPGDTVAPQEPEVDLEPETYVEAKASTVPAVSSQNGSHVETATAQALVKHFIDEARAAQVPMPRKVIGHIARSVGELLDEGHTPQQVWAGLGRMVERRVVQPSLLPNFVTEAAIPRQQSRRYGYGVQSSEIDEHDPELFGPGNEYLDER